MFFNFSSKSWRLKAKMFTLIKTMDNFYPVELMIIIRTGIFIQIHSLNKRWKMKLNKIIFVIMYCITNLE